MTLHEAESISPPQQLSQRPVQAKFRPDIEGLRAVAVLAVVLFHAKIPGVGGGFVGVDVFFVISGFLITRMLWREAQLTGTVGLRGFYGARARRLLPASAFVGVVILFVSAAMLPRLQARSAIWDGITSALYVSNYRFIIQDVDYMHASAMPSPFQHYWSLGVEEQFYLVWPALIMGTAWFVRRFRRRTRTEAIASLRPYLVVLTSVAIVSFALSLVLTYWMAPVAFFSLPTRAWQLAVGGLIALTATRWNQLSSRSAALIGWIGLVVVIAACTFFGEATPYPGGAALAPTLGTAMVIAAGCASPTQGVARLLGIGFMRYIGRISYSWYLWHWPILLMIFWSYVPALGHPVEFGLAGVVISAGLAMLTVRFVENPLRFAPRIRSSPSRSLALGGVATALAVSTGLALLTVTPTPVGRGAPAAPLSFSAIPVPPPGADVAAYVASVHRAFAEVQAAVAESADVKAVPSNLDPPISDPSPAENVGVPEGCLRSFYDVGQPECASGDVNSGTTVALLGDSNAAMWSPVFEQVAEQRHWRLETLTRGLCPFMDLPPIIDPTRGQPYTECGRWRHQIIERLRAERPKLVVLAMMRQYGASYGWKLDFNAYDPTWLDSLTRMVIELRSTGTQVLVLGPIPIPPSAVPDCLATHLDDATACAPTTSKGVDAAGIAAERVAVRAGGGQYADLTDLFCTAERCPVIVGNTLVYMDLWHTTVRYSTALAPAIGALTDLALASG